VPIALSSLGFILAGAIAQADDAHAPGLGGYPIALGAIFLALLLGVLTAVANCGSASLAAKAGRPCIRAYNTGAFGRSELAWVQLRISAPQPPS